MQDDERMLNSIRDRVKDCHYRYLAIPIAAFSTLLVNSFVNQGFIDLPNLPAYAAGAILFSIVWLNVYHMYKYE